MGLTSSCRDQTWDIKVCRDTELRCRVLISKTHDAHIIGAGPAHMTPGAAAAEAGTGLTSNLRARAGRSTCAGTEASLPDMRNTVGTAASGPRVSCARAHAPRQILRSRACTCCKRTPVLALPTAHSACSHISLAQTHPHAQALVVCESRAGTTFISSGVRSLLNMSSSPRRAASAWKRRAVTGAVPGHSCREESSCSQMQPLSRE